MFNRTATLARLGVAEETTEAAFFENASGIIAKDLGVQFDNAEGRRQSGKSGSIHAHMVTNLKNSEFHSDVATIGGDTDGEDFVVPDVIKEGMVISKPK